MSTKTTFKRIALVAVAALGLGVLSVAPSQAAFGTPTVTLSASTASVSVGDSVTVTGTINLTSSVGSETFTVAAIGTGAVSTTGAGASQTAGTVLLQSNSDSSNVTFTGTGKSAGAIIQTTSGSLVTNETLTVTTSGSSATAKYSITIMKAANIGTFRYNFNLYQGGAGTLLATSYFDVTVAAKNTTAAATKSLMWVNATGYTSADYGTFPLRADSTISITAGDATSPAQVAVLTNTMMNSSDTNTVTGSAVTGSMLVVVSGPGLVSVGVTGTKAKSATMTEADTLVVWSDGTAGVMTLTGSIGGVNLTQAAKAKITFFGKPSTITATLESATVVTGSTATGAISLVIKDSAGTALKTLDASQKNTGTPGGVFVLVSDTKVVGPAYTAVTAGATAAYGGSACTYNTSTTNWLCNITITDSGTVSIQIGDSYTAATSVAVSAAVSLKVAGGAWTGTLALDKATYATGEKAILTITAKDYAAATVIDGAHTPFASMIWGDKAPVFPAGGDGTDIKGYITGGTTSFVSGVDTYVVYMPTTAGTYTLSGTTNGVDKKAVSLTFTVTDAAAVAAAAATAAAKDASDAATDAALEATDAAYAATDAANIAAEAADAATAAAEAATEAANAAKESADAATAAVEELATSVAKLMAALQAQITTLAKVVAKIAVKVKA